jgi:hypothetical protein
LDDLTLLEISSDSESYESEESGFDDDNVATDATIGKRAAVWELVHASQIGLPEQGFKNFKEEHDVHT